MSETPTTSRREQALAAAGVALVEPEPNAAVEPPPVPMSVVTQLPAELEAWDRQTEGSYAPEYLKRLLDRQIQTTGKVDGDMLDQIVLDMRVSGMSYSEIARKLPPMTAEEVQLRLRPVLARMEQITAAEGRALQVIRLEKFINMLWSFVAGGSVQHADTMVKVLERLGKTLDLESERATITVDYVSKAQEEIIGATVDAVVGTIMRFYDKKFTDAGYEPIAHEVIDALVAEVLTQASTMVSEAQENPIVLEKGRGGVLQPVRPPDKV